MKLQVPVGFFATLLVILIGTHARAEEGVLRWGADIESGAPFSFKDPSDPEKVIGYEAELVEVLAKKLGRKVEFYQNNWEGLIEGLKRKDYDIVVNGLEITPDRQMVVNFSRPYYVTNEVITVRRTENQVTTLENLKNKNVGALASSLAQRILTEQPFPINIIPYNEEVLMYNDLAMGRTDAVFMDEIIALYYAKPHPMLKVVGGGVGRMEYGVATRKGDPLTRQIDTALAEMIRDGTIRGILEKWGIWNEMTAKEWKMDPTPKTPAVEYDRYMKVAFTEVTIWERLKRYASFLPMLGKGALMTLHISITSMALAIIVGLLTALARLYGPRPVRWASIAYVEAFRGTPLLIQLYLIFYGLPHIGLRLDPFLSAVIGLGLNYGACEAENYRAGILSVPHTQMDAAKALGMNWCQSLRHIVMPQAIRLVIPPVTNDFIALLKDSSLVSVITMVELTSTYGQLASTYFDYLGIGMLAAAVYFLIGLPFVRLSRKLEDNLEVSQNRTRI